MPGAPSSASTTRPELSAKAGRPVACAAASALMRALSRKLMPVFVRFRQIEFTRRYGVDAVRRKQFAHLGELAGIMRRDHETAGDAAMLAHITAIFCKSTSLAMPLRASANSAANCSSENGVFSAVACISTILPVPVRTKLASVSACESSA